MKLPDLNVWLAALWEGHQQHPVARRWLDTQSGDIALCRITQMGLLRLMTNPVMLGGDALNRLQAWDTLLRLRRDPRISFLEEPPGLETLWMRLSSRPDRAHKLWTDDYLAAFASLCGATLVTFDRALSRRHPGLALEILR